MKLVKASTQVWVWIGAGIFLVLVLGVQLFLSMRQEYPIAVSDEFTATSRAFVDQAKETLEKRHEQTTP
jgi:hypothetical protein